MAYSPVFSVPLILYSSADPIVEFEVPPGFTAVVREIDIYTEAGGAVVIAALSGPGSGIFINFASVSALGVATSGQWTGRVALPENYILGLDNASLGAGDTVYVGGYLLRNVLT